jgi:hypothetical protein
MVLRTEKAEAEKEQQHARIICHVWKLLENMREKVCSSARFHLCAHTQQTRRQLENSRFLAPSHQSYCNILLLNNLNKMALFKI